VEEVEVVVAHHERATLRVGDVFLKIDADQARTDVEVEAMAMAPIPTPESCGASRPCSRSPPSPGQHSAASASRRPRRRRRGPRRAPPHGCCTTRRCRHGPAGASTRSHRTRRRMRVALTNGVLPTDLVTRNRRVAEAALRPWTPVFAHGDLQVSHVFVDGDEITGVIDWSEAARAMPCSTSPA
jgi:hypothetical protein